MKTEPNDTICQAIGEGLTKREHFAGLAMQGYCAYQHAPHCDAVNVAEYAVQLADALIAELNKEPKP